MGKEGIKVPLLQPEAVSIPVAATDKTDFLSSPNSARVTLYNEQKEELVVFAIRMKVKARSQQEADLYARHTLEEHATAAHALVMKALHHEISAASPNDPQALTAAIDVIHHRTFEAYFCWSEKQRIEFVSIAKSKLAETILYRTVGSISEHILHCPERVAQEVHEILVEKMSTSADAYIIDLDLLQTGLSRVHECNEKNIINFEDINNCAALNSKKIYKSFLESQGAMVLVDFLRNYHPILFLKAWTLAAVLFLHILLEGDTMLDPEDQIRYWQIVAQVDSVAYLLISVLLFVYTVLYQEKEQPIRIRSWFHVTGLLFSGVGFMWIWLPQLLGSPGETFQLLIYFLFGRLLMGVMYEPLFARWFGRDHRVRFGRPLWARRKFKRVKLENSLGGLLNDDVEATSAIDGEEQVFRTETKGQKCLKIICTPCNNYRIYNYEAVLFWVVIFTLTVLLEYFVVAPIGLNLTYKSLCANVCSNDFSLFNVTQSSDRCDSCVLSLAAVYALMAITSFVDLFVIFNVVLALWGYFKGRTLGLHNVYDENRNKIDFTANGDDRESLTKLFGTWKRGVNVWNTVITDLYLRDEMSKYQLNRLFMNEDEHVGPDRINLMPLLPETKERLTFFIKTLKALSEKMKMDFGSEPLAAEKRFLEAQPSVSQIITTYSEVILQSESYLKKMNGNYSNLEHLIKKFPREWLYFERRMRYLNLHSREEPTNLLDYFLQPSNSLSPQAVMEIREWASNRTQTVGRTIRGALTAHEATRCRIKWLQEECAEKPELGISCDLKLSDMIELVVSAQTYGSKGNDEALGRRKDLEYLVQKYEKYPITIVYDYNDKSAWDEEKVLLRDYWNQKTNQNREAYPFQFATCMKRMVNGQLTVIAALPRRYPLRLGKGEFMTQGKAANHLNAVRTLWGHVTQVMDANMDAFMGEGFKVPFTTHQFQFRSAAGVDRKNVQYRIIGFREFIFTHPLGYVGQTMASSELAFGTIVQRVLNDPLGVRMHYGHPDFFDTFWMLNRGGPSKASACINLSEDIFAGYNTWLRKESIHHVDTLEWQKGREEAFSTASMFLMKITQGAMAMLRTKDMVDLNLGLDILTRLSLFTGGIGSFFFQLLLCQSLFMYLFVFFFFVQAGITSGALTKLHSSLGAEWILGFGIAPALPLLAELILERKLFRGVWYFVREYIPTTLFYIFQNQMIAAAAVEGIVTGTAHYQNTGRPTFFDTYSKVLAYKLYVKSHYYPALAIIGLFIFICFLSPNSQFSITLLFLGLFGLCWIACPVLFVAQVDVWSLFVADSKHCWMWLLELTDHSKDSFFEFWKTDTLRHRSVDAWVTAFWDFVLALIEAIIVFVVCSSQGINHVIPFVLVLAVHVAVTLIWHFLRKWFVITALWLLIPLGAFIALVALPSYINEALGLKQGTFVDNVLAVVLIFSWVRLIPFAFRFVATLIIRIGRQVEVARDVEHPTYNEWLTFLHLLVPYYTLHFYACFCIFLIQTLVHLGLLLLIKWVKLSSCIPYRDLARGVGPKKSDDDEDGSGNNSPRDSPRVLQTSPKLEDFVFHLPRRAEAKDDIQRE